VAYLEGRRGPETRRPRLSLTTWRGRKIAQHGSVEQSNNSDNADPAQRFENWLWAERNDWSIRARSGLLGSGRRLDKVEAARALRAELTALAAGGGA